MSIHNHPQYSFSTNPGTVTQQQHSMLAPPQHFFPEASNPYLYAPIGNSSTLQYNNSTAFRGVPVQQSSFEPILRPEVVDYSPKQGLPGTTVKVQLRSTRDLFSSPKVYYSLIFGAKRRTASLSRMDDLENMFTYNLAADAAVNTETWVNDTVPLFISMDGPEGQHYDMFSIGEFKFGDDFETPVYNSTPTYSRKRKSSMVEPDLFNTPSKRPFIQQLADGETCVPHHITSGYAPTGWKTDIPRGFFGPPSSFSLGDVAPRSSSLDDQVVSPKNANYTPERNCSIFDDKYSGLGIMAPASFPTLTPNQMGIMDSMANPPLCRTSTLQSSGNGLSGSSPQGFTSYGMPQNKATLKMGGDLDGMADGWTDEECAAKRRIVQFERRQSGSIIHTSFGPVTPETRSPNSICVSCIWWEEKNEAFVTSVDTIHLLESLVGSRFTVEEKNRIRRNLEGFRPLTVSKAKLDSDSFFKTIMAFPNPKPRNIEKDVKVFPWKILSHALKKIIGKYSASYTSPVPSAPSMTHQTSTASFLSSIDMQDHSRVVSPMPFDMQSSSFDQTPFGTVGLSPRLLSLKPTMSRSISAGQLAGQLMDGPTHHYQQEWRRRQSSDGAIPQFQLPENWDFSTYMDAGNSMSVLSSIPSSTFPPWCGDAFGRQPIFLDQVAQP